MNNTGVVRARMCASNLGEVSKFGFEPIIRPGFQCRTIYHAAPVAVRRERGVDLGPFAKSEIQEYVDTGPMGGKDALRARAELLERRGGVLPANWTVAEHYKANLELMESIRIRGRGGD